MPGIMKKAKQRKLVDTPATSNTICDGTIERVKLKNFLTYDDCEFRPGPHLNVILGPNGTGKSSIVCAICLGLGGHPNLLGRAREVGDFVKHRANSAFIEIELKRAFGTNLIIRRDIFRNDNRSVWKINGKASTQKEVLEKVKSLNIQMNNLCQFLPQDRVVEFAKMSPQQLLVATEKAVGPPGMHEAHEKLIELREKEKKVQASLNEKSAHKEKVEQRNKLLEREVQRFHERQKHMETVDMLQKKKPWAEYEVARLKFIDIKEERDACDKRLKAAKKVNAPLEEQLNEAKKVYDEQVENTRKLGDIVNQSSRSAAAKRDELEKEDEKISDVRNEFRQAKEQESTRLKRISDLQVTIQALEKELENAPNAEEFQPRLEEIREDTKKTTVRLSNLQQEANNIKAESGSLKANIQALTNELDTINDMRNRRMQKLKEIDKEAYNAAVWLSNNKDKFKGQVFEPIMLHINMKKQEDSKYLEELIPRKDMTAFVCELEEDQYKFLEEVRDNQKLRVAVVCPPMQPVSKYKPRVPMETLKKFGFVKFVIELFEAPEVVLRYLCESCHVHQIPIGTNEVRANISNVIEKSGLHDFFTPQARYNVRTSIYGNREKSTSVTYLKAGRVRHLEVSVDVERKRSLEQELQGAREKYNEFTSRYKELSDEQKTGTSLLEKLRVEKKELASQMSRRKTIQSQIDTKKKSLQATEKDAVDLEGEEAQLRIKIRKINETRVKLLEEHKTTVEKCVEATKQKILSSFLQSQAALKISRIEQTMQETSHALHAIMEEYQNIKKAFDAQKGLARRLLKIAREKTGTAEGEELPQELKDAFGRLPNELDLIEQMIHEETAKADCHYQTNPEVLREYKKNAQEINILDKQVQEQDSELKTLQKDLEEVKEGWLKPLEELVAQISERFCDFFRRMGCAGDVSLSIDPDNNYEKFGIEIKVKFRSEEKLKVLTSHHQSGGERSVSTMLYLISLQELINCPFRVVDEINQGMDPNNERRVFELVVETVCRPGTSQYFLMTPKLLPDLTYTERVTILTVLNGHWLLPHAQAQIKDFIQKKRRMLTAS